MYWIVALLIFGARFSSQAEDADRYRPYVRFQDGDFDPLWGVDDMLSLGFGANANWYLGGELTLDYYERNFRLNGSTIGEVSSYNLLPYLRLRYPVKNDRLVPYMVLGVGPSFIQWNDRKKAAFGKAVDIEGTSLAVGAGVGLEYFVADNIAVGIEAKYIWVDSIDGSVGGQRVSVDESAPLFTFGFRAFFDENEPRPLVQNDGYPTRRVYLGMRAGGFILTDNSWVPNINLTPEAAHKNNVNIDGGVAVGMDMNEYWGVELAADSMEPNISINGRGAVGEYGMGTVIHYFRFRTAFDRGRLVPYIMAGPGAVYGEFNDVKEASLGLNIDAKGIYPGVGVGGGLEYFITRNLSISADARWLYTWGHQISVNNVNVGTGDFAMVQFNLGLRLYLFEWLKGNNQKKTY